MIPVMRHEKPLRIAIIGAGFSGTMVATHLARLSTGEALDISLIDQREEHGRGLAYSTECTAHLLNVPAGRMSAFPGEPQHFTGWLCRNHHPRISGGEFIPRSTYGAYLNDTLARTLRGAPLNVRFHRLFRYAVRLQDAADGMEVHFRDGSSLQVDRVVLALGNPPPRPLPVAQDLNGAFASSLWSANSLEGLHPQDSVVLIGSGLTSVDAALALRERGHKGLIHMLSRHGRLPQAHASHAACAEYWPEKAPATVRGLVRLIRDKVRQMENQEPDWRGAIDALRARTNEVWQTLPPAERRRFLRHLRVYWDIHRHRMAPQIAAVIANMREEGLLHLVAGRVVRMSPLERGVRVWLTPRGRNEVAHIDARRAVNCTSPEYDLRRSDHPLLHGLFADGLGDSGPLGCGLRVAPDGALVDSRGNASSTLFALGPLLWGTLFETVAVPELRVQAQALATRLLEDLPVQAADPAEFSAAMLSA